MMQLPQFVKHAITGEVFEVKDARPIGNALFYECETRSGDERIVRDKDTRPATVEDWNKAVL